VARALPAPPSAAEPHLRRDVSVWGSFMWGFADVGADIYVALGLVIATAAGASLAMAVLAWRGRERATFLASSLLILLLVGSAALALYPALLIATTGRPYDLTIYNSSATHYALTAGLVWAGVGLLRGRLTRVWAAAAWSTSQSTSPWGETTKRINSSIGLCSRLTAHIRNVADLPIRGPLSRSGSAMLVSALASISGPSPSA